MLSSAHKGEMLAAAAGINWALERQRLGTPVPAIDRRPSVKRHPELTPRGSVLHVARGGQFCMSPDTQLHGGPCASVRRLATAGCAAGTRNALDPNMVNCY